MTIQPIDLVLNALHHQGVRHGGEYKCHCPAHDDNKESLAVTEAEDGRVLLKCHAGCASIQVMKAMGLTWKDLFPKSSTKTPSRSSKVKTNVRGSMSKIVASYDYHDENNQLVYQSVRLEPKSFWQRRPDGKGDWLWNMNGMTRVLYRLPELLASDHSHWVFVVEGEKDVDRVRSLNLVATCNVGGGGGAGKWADAYSETLRGRRVCIIPDNDNAGRVHANKVAQSLIGTAAQVRVLELPNLPLKGDISDWLDAGGDAAQLLEMVDKSPDYITPHQPDSSNDSDDSDTSDDAAKSKNQSKISQADALYEIASTHAEIFTGQDGEAYAFVPIEGRRECYKLRSKGFSGWLTALYRTIVGKMPTSQAREDAVAALTWDARGKLRDVFIRVGAHGGKVYIDLGTEQWDAIEVDADGWRVVLQPPVAFRRTASLKPLPLPQHGGALSQLRKYLNIESEHWPLVIAWLVAACNATGPYPILVLVGEQGTAKSTTLKVLKLLIDPSAAGLRGQPSEIRDLMIGAGNGWLLAFDNVSHLNGDLSDALCRVATGGGYAKRANYSDDGEFLLDVQRPVAINGIGDLITRPDLMDRCILLCPPVIPEGKRRGETEFWQEFNQERPLLLGALLDSLSMALRNIASIQLPTLPRMADFARLAVAAEPAFESDLSFLDAYQANQEEAHATVVETSTMGEHLHNLVSINGVWEGTATELLHDLNFRASEVEKRAVSWPTAPNRLKPALQRLAPSLRHIGVEVEFPPRADRGGTRRIRVARLNV